MKPKMVFSFRDSCVLFSAVLIGLLSVPRLGIAGPCEDLVAQECNSSSPTYDCTIFNLPPIERYGVVYNCRAAVAYETVSHSISYIAYLPGDNGFGCDCLPNTFPRVQAPSPSVLPSTQCGSIIHNDNQAVGETVPVVGTPFSLSYFSDRVSGRIGNYSIFLPSFSGQNGSTVTVLGRILPGIDLGNSGKTFLWDGTDSSGNITPGQALAHVDVAVQYGTLADFNTWYNCHDGTCPFPSLTLTSTQSYDVPIGTFQAISMGLGGWTLSVHHFYDLNSNTIYLGDGGTRIVTAKLVDNGTHYVAASEDGSLLFVFDLQGYHLKTLNALTGATIYSFSYDTQRHLTQIVDAYNNTTSIQRDSNGKITGIQAPYGQVTQLSLDSNGYLATITNPNNEVYTATYVDSGGLLRTFKKPLGQISTFAYDAKGLLQSDQSTSGSSTTFAWNDSGSPFTQLFTSTSAMGVSSSFQIISTAGSSNRTETLGDGTQLVQQLLTNQSLSTQRSGGTSQAVQYTPDPRLGSIANFISSTGVNNGSYTWQSSSLQTVSSYTPSSDLQSFFDYGTISTQNNINGNTWSTSYSLQTGVTEQISPEGRHVQTTADAYGKVSSIVEPGRAAVNLSYTSHGQLSQVTQGSRSNSITYNSQGYMDQITNPLSQMTSFTYDGAGRILTQTLPDARVISYSYDANGNVTSITPPGKPAHGFSLNPFDLISQYLPPALGGGSSSTQYSYNNDRQIIGITRPDGTLISFNYSSSSGLLSSVVLPTGQYAYTYGYQRLATATSPDSIQIQRSYFGDLLGDETVTGPDGSRGSSSRTWTNDFRLASSTMYSRNSTTSSSVNFSYDRDGLLTQAGSETLTRDPSSGLLSGTTLSTLSDSYSYDSTYAELSAYSALYTPTSGSAKNLMNQTFTRDALGRITGKTEKVATYPTDTFSYTYDSAGRLTDVTKSGVTTHYGYDSNGNRTAATTGSSSVTATYDSQDRLLTYGSKSYTYSLNGEMLSVVDSSRPTGRQTTSYSYDALGNLKQVALTYPGPQTISYKYDGLNRRVAKLVDGVIKEQYLYEDQNRIGALLDGTGALKQRYVYGSKPNVPDYLVTSSGSLFKIISDPNGSVRVVVGASIGNLVQAPTYDEFGNVISVGGAGIWFEPFGFAGGLYDVDTKLVHFGARDYDASVGRWIQKDPAGFDGGDTNLYGYGLTDPINNIDPSGLSSVVFNRATGTIDIYSGSGQLLATFPASNSPDSRAPAGHVPTGTFSFSHVTSHPESNASGRYGSHGNFVFNFPNGTGIGVHSGREGVCDSAGRCGYRHATNGCIRTTDSATNLLQKLNNTDPITSITVQ